MKNKTNINNVGFLISPTTHLFPLSGQSGSCGVSSIITLNLKILKSSNEDWKYTMLQITTKLKKNWKMQKTTKTQILE